MMTVNVGICFLVSLLAGRFLASFVDQWPQEKSGAFRLPGCRQCGGQDRGILGGLPLIGWFMGGGQCRTCGKEESPVYPVMEWGAIGLFLWSWAVLPEGRLWVGCFLGWTLIALAVIDSRHFILPDFLTVPLTISGLIYKFFIVPDMILEAIIGGGLGYLLFAAVAWAYRHLRHREGLGLGDAKLLAAAGVWVGWQGLPAIILLSAVGGLIFGLVRGISSTPHKPHLINAYIPYGPFLAMAFWLVWLYGQ